MKYYNMLTVKILYLSVKYDKIKSFKLCVDMMEPDYRYFNISTDQLWWN